MITMTELFELIEREPGLLRPEKLTLACGHTVPNAAGTEVWDYYDWKFATMREAVSHLHHVDIDTSDRLPNGITYWLPGTSVDCSRSTCRDCATRRP